MVNGDIQKLNPGTVVDLYELDVRALGGEQFYFHAGVNELGNNIIWQGISYARYPIEVSGFEKTGQGTLPRPTITAANINGVLTQLAKAYQGLLGAKLIRRRTFIKYLDAVNFSSGNAYADPNAHFADEVWFIDRKSGENPIFIEFELAAAFDVSGVLLPRRQCIQNTCIWKYRSTECGFSGGAVADINDVPTTDINNDVCGKKLNSCKLRFGTNGVLPYGGFPGVGLIS
jgi:lambda family phage minor tail protein L